MTEKELPVTEVTSIAKEEEKSGEKINMPSEEEIAQRATMSFFRHIKEFNDIFGTLSARGKGRVMNAVLALPVDGVPVYLKDKQEKEAFFLGQRAISDRFIITQYHISEQIREAKAAAEKAKAEAEKNKEQKSEETLDKETQE